MLIDLVSINIPITAAITALGGIIAAPVASIVTAWINNRNADRANKSANDAARLLAASSVKTEVKLDQIHELVNSRLTKALDHIRMLETLLLEATGRPVQGEPPHQ